MPNDDTYQGSANRETWAFNLHWSNTESLYLQTLAMGRELLAHMPDATDSVLGDGITRAWRDLIDTDREHNPRHLQTELHMWDREVGSWWRISDTEVGAAVRESITVETP